jgi:hypothetical protein
MVYAATREEATEKVEALAREVVESKDVEVAFA